jgi:hypothetical protein
MSPGAQNMKTGADTLGTAKKSPGVQNMKTGPDALGTAENKFGRTKHENGTRRPRSRRKRVRERKTRKRYSMSAVPSETSLGGQNIKTGPDALRTAGNDFGSVKHENGSQRPRYRRK